MSEFLLHCFSLSMRFQKLERLAFSLGCNSSLCMTYKGEVNKDKSDLILLPPSFLQKLSRRCKLPSSTLNRKLILEPQSFIRLMSTERMDHDTRLQETRQGRRKVWKSGGGSARSAVVDIICPPGWDRVNGLAKHPLPPLAHDEYRTQVKYITCINEDKCYEILF